MHWPTILVVDDEASIRTSVRLCLESAGYVVQQANNGRAALDQLVRDPPDLMLLGASDFLEKPFTPEDLRLSVAGVLREEPVDRGSCGQGYTGALANARQALRERRFRDAERELMKAGTIAGDDPAFLNLAGEWHEARGRIASAKRFFARAVAKDCTYRPARENLVRLGEFYAGATSRPAQVVPMGRRLSAL